MAIRIMKGGNDIYQTEVHMDAENKLHFCMSIAHEKGVNFMAKIQIVRNVMLQSGLLVKDNFLEHFLILIARKRGIWRAKQDTDELLKGELFQGQAQSIELIERVLMSVCMEINEGKRFEEAKKLALDAEAVAYTEETEQLAKIKSGKIIAGMSRGFRKLFRTITYKK